MVSIHYLLIKYLLRVLLLGWLSGTLLSAQEHKHEFNLGFGSTIGIGGYVPFWLLSNQHGLLDVNPFNLYTQTGYKKLFTSHREIDFSAGVNVINRFHDHYDIYLEEIYGKLKLYSLNLQAGRVKERFGNQDPVLSSGGALWSGNTRPVPKISLYTPHYVSIPFTHGYLQIKGGLAHGWLGDNSFVENTLLHHKYLYAKAGGKLPVNIIAGIHHYAQWGGTSLDPSIGEFPGGFREYMRVFIAREGGSGAHHTEQINATGNHIGSYQLGADMTFRLFDIGLYWQSIFEDNSGRKNRNLWDGLYGMSLLLNNNQWLNRVVFELLVTTHQSGKPVYDSQNLSPPQWNDNYFNHHLYKTGWSYMGMTIGTPLITSPILFTEDEIDEYFVNNRVRALHSGLTGETPFFEYILMYTFSLNYGTHYVPFEKIRKQHFFKAGIMFREIIKKTDFSFIIGIDRGKLIGNNAGIQFSLARKLQL